MINKISTLRFVGKIEGWSLLILFFIAMPLKYIFDIPLAVKIVGTIHGALFSTFVLMLIGVSIKHRFSFGFSLLAFIASLIPFGTFFLNRKLAKLQQKTIY